MFFRYLLRIHHCAWLLTGLLLGFWGCAKHEPIVTLPIPSASPFSSSGQVEMPELWWSEFDDSALNDQIGRSLGGSYTLDAAVARLRAAQALARREASDFWPDVNGFGDFESFLRTDGPNESVLALGLDMTYPVDLWGQIESRVDAERLRSSATQKDYQTVALALAAEIAGTWFSLIEARAQLELLNEQLETNLKGLEYQEAQFAVRQNLAADVLRQRQLVESTREQLVVAQARVDVLEHQLAVLEGRSPQDASYVTGNELPALPPLPDTGLPSELLMRRPDVRRDFLALAAADRDLAAAVSDQYPRLSLTASVVTATEHPENLFREWVASIGSQMIAPLIDGGQRRAEVDRRNALVRQRFDEYCQTVLVAYQEVEDALTREHYQLARLERLNAQLELARRTSPQLLEYNITGEADYLDYLSAVTAEQRLQRETLSARLDLVLNRIALYLALAGDFELRPQNPDRSRSAENVDDE